MRTKSSLSPVRRVAGLSCLILATGTLVGVTFATVPAAAAPVSPTPPDYASAADQAQATEQPVEVTDQTTETTQVLANPDGTFSMTTDREPVRVKQDDQWTPIDTTLQRNPDGSLSPVATTADVSFSGGGSGPVISLADGDRSVAFTWPTPLPTPSITGNSATYAAVLPGVDLKMRATATGYSEVLVVHDAAAAADPALQQLHLRATATGLNLTPAAGGGLTATDADNNQVFSGTAPTMWDSTIDPQVGATPAPFDAGSGQISLLGLSAAPADGTTSTASTTVTLTPPAAALTGADVHYPVFIDPQMNGPEQDFDTLFDNGAHYFNSSTLGDLKVGYCDFSDCGSFDQLNARAYFQLGIGQLAGTGTAHIFAASVNTNELHAADGCTAQPVDLFSSGDISATTTFPGPRISLLQEVSTAVGDNCGGAGTVSFNNANVVSYLQAKANANASSVTFGLLPADPNNSAEWKRFSTNPAITITYNYIPAVPTATGVTGEVDCAGKHFVADTTPQVTGKGHDYNPSPLNTYLRFNIYPAGGPNPYASSGDVQKTSDSIGAYTSSHPLTNGAWEYSVNDHNIPNSPYDEWSPSQSARYPFTVETPPTTTPTISSLDYPTGNWGAPQAAIGGKFTVSDGGATTTAGFSYGWDSASNVQALQATNCNYNQINGTTSGLVAGTNSATITAPNLTPGPHTLYLKIFDNAHNLGTHLASYSFYVSPSINPAATKFEAETLTATTGKFSQSTATDPVYAENGSGYSNGQQEHLEPAAVGHSFSFTVSTGIEADDALGLQLSTANHFGQYQISIDGTPVLDPNKAADPNNPSANYLQLDAYSASPGVRFVSLGGMHLAGGPHQITLAAIGKNAASVGVTDHGINDVGLALAVDFLTVIPINHATTASFSDAMNNRGIAIDASTAADLKTASPAVGLSTVALASTGYAPGAVVSIAGASFTMPARNPAGNDNVIASGQTIPFPTGTPNQQVHATDVALLANSTCFSTGSGSVRRTGSITYTDGTTSVAVFPAIPDWASGASSAAAINLDHQDIGTAASTAVQPKLYAILVPADPSKTLQSITMPNYGTSFLTGSCPPAVHIYAIAPRPVATGWLGTWAAPADLAATPPGGAGFANQTIRLTVHPTITGPTMRARLANTYAKTPVTIDAASIAAQASTGPATTGNPTALTFCAATGQALGCGVHTITIPAGAEAVSDPTPTPDTTTGSGNLIISLHLPTAVTLAPTHLAGNTTNYIATGDLTTNTDGTPFTSTTTNSYYLTGLDASTTDATQGTVVVLGDETTARGASTGATDYQPTWVDDLPAHLASSGTILPGGLVNTSMNGQTSAWWRDADTGATLNNTALNEPNIRTVIVSLGAQDLLNNVPVSTIEDNIKALIQNTNTTDYGLRNHHRTTDTDYLHVVLTNIPALQLPANDPREANRQQLNNDLANYTNFGATDFIDLDTATHDPNNPNQLDPSLTTTPGGTPTPTYYNHIADLIANAVPPVL